MPSVKQIISDAGLRATKAREAVLSTILDADSALSHSEVLARLSKHHDFDRVTVYRVLDWLTEHQLIHKISGHDRAWKFQASQLKQAPKHASQTVTDDEHRHAHLHCSACDKVLCIHELSPVFSQALLNKYQVTQVQVNLEGLCPDCTKMD